ncbi:MAG: PAS domain S-box protein [Pirellulales bacterium]|nr:PAS domain S-box protein [Pirellulales bacterium]
MDASSDQLDADALASVLAVDPADFVCLTNVHGEPFYLNLSGRRMVGESEETPASRISLREFYDAHSWTELQQTAVPKVNKAGHWEGRVRLRKIGSEETFEVHARMFRIKSSKAGRPYCLAIVHRRMDKDSDLRAALAEARARKNAILESSLDPIITINHEGVITEFNRAAELCFGHSREKVLGTTPTEVLFPPADGPGQKDRIDRYLTAGEGSQLGRRVEVTAVRAGGETFDAEMAMTIGQEQGAPALTFFIRDISREKKAEREQARYAAELVQSNRELEQFAYVASHDLQEPLRKIRTFCDRLQIKLNDKLDEEGQDSFRRIQNAVERMQALIEGLLSLSRVTTRGRDFVAVDLRQVALEVVSDLEAQIERVGGRVELGHLPSIQADPLQMRQLLQNLIANSLKFHRQDEPPVVKVYGRFAHGRDKRPAGLTPGEERCRIAVEDNGIGFEPKYQRRIFDVFQRLHNRDAFEGVGIGLALCRKIVERHGGEISVRSVPGRGSTFEVVLPVARDVKQE